MEKTYFALISERKLDDSFLHPNLTILSGKNCVLLNSVKNGCLAASELFYLFTQSVKAFTFHYHSLKVQMFEN